MLTLVITIIGLFGAAAGVLGLLYARRNNRVKLFVWEPTVAVPIASLLSAERDYKLSILYERPGYVPELIPQAYITYLRVANRGKEPIRSEDIAKGNRLKIGVEMPQGGNSRVLDISLGSKSRDVIGLSVGDVMNFGNVAQATINFDFLDHQDGGIVRILSTEPPSSIEMTGDIIGMPGGIVRSDVPQDTRRLGKPVFAIWAAAQVGAVALTLLLFDRVTGDLSDAWLLGVLPAVFLAITAVAAVVDLMIRPPTSRKFPSVLQFPEWLDIHVLESRFPRWQVRSDEER